MQCNLRGVTVQFQPLCTKAKRNTKHLKLFTGNYLDSSRQRRRGAYVGLLYTMYVHTCMVHVAEELRARAVQSVTKHTGPGVSR